MNISEEKRLYCVTLEHISWVKLVECDDFVRNLHCNGTNALGLGMRKSYSLTTLKPIGTLHDYKIISV